MSKLPPTELNPAKTPGDYDPPHGKRIYLKNVDTGQLGWIVRRGGRDMVKFDRSNQEIIVKYEQDTWLRVVDERPFSRAQLVVVAFEADKVLLRILGDYKRAGQSWLSLSDEQRKVWIEDGPTNPPIRAILYQSIMGTLEEHMR